MPDWSYQTVLKPAFFRVPADASRRFVVSFLRQMTSLPQAYRLIDLMGHMAPERSLARTVAGVEFSSPVGLAPVIDPEGRAVDAFSRFGFGWIVIGPVGIEEPTASPVFTRDPGSSGIAVEPGHAVGLERARGISIRTGASVQLAFELALPEGEPHEVLAAGRALIEGLAGRANLLVLSPRTSSHLESRGKAACQHALAELVSIARDAGVPLFVGLPVTRDEAYDDILAAIAQAGAAGVYFSGRAGPGSGRWSWSEDDGASAVDRLTSVRSAYPDLPVIVDGGVCSPRQALELDEAGADLVLLGTGLVYTGPSLAKRLNEAFELRDNRPDDSDTTAATPPERRAWFWGAALGIAMLVGAVLATWVALTSVLLPYDEAFLGKSRQEIEAFNFRIVHFMTHDRITLAGTMTSIAVLYISLSIFAIRKGHHWAQRVVSFSAMAGFLTFFAFLGFGYFDPFHAFVTVILFQLFIQLLVRPLGVRRHLDASPPLDNDRAWKLSQWGQLCFIVQAVGLLAGGATIMFFGMTSVFVAEDITFLGMEPATIIQFDPELKSLIAHDRATFGGMLISAGIGLLFMTLWSFRRGDRWLWWTYLLTILPPYVMTLWIHSSISYTDHFHLSPVYIGIGLLVLGLTLSASHLMRATRVVLDPGS